MWFKDVEHFKKENGYEVGGAWYPRVTRILEVKAKPGLQVFFKEMGSFDAAEDVKNKSAEEGTLVHETVQKIAVGERIEIPKKIEPAVTAFQKFQDEKQIFFYPEFIESSSLIDGICMGEGDFAITHLLRKINNKEEYIKTDN